MAEFLLVRHAPIAKVGVLAGRSDLACVLPECVQPWVRDIFSTPRMVSSPALRCQMTAKFLSDREFATDPRLWEQDFGDWDGKPFGDIPDLGPLSRAETAQIRPPGGESFADLVARIGPVLDELAETDGQMAIIAHAGVIRAALSMALGAVEAGLAFEIAPLSLTLLAKHGQDWSIKSVNQSLLGDRF